MRRLWRLLGALTALVLAASAGVALLDRVEVVDLARQAKDAAGTGPTLELVPVEGVVTRVVDGDTLYVGDLSVRLLGVDAPETQRRIRGTPWCLNAAAADAATAAVEALALGQHVTLADVEDDSAGRDMAARVVLDDGTDLGAWLVDHGHAVPWPADSPATACPPEINGGQEPNK